MHSIKRTIGNWEVQMSKLVVKCLRQASGDWLWLPIFGLKGHWVGIDR
jgi:hypothetical protein